MKRLVLLSACLFALVTAVAEPSPGDLRTAFAAAESGPQARYRQAERELATHPLLPWLQATYLARDIGGLAADALAEYQQRWPDAIAADWLRQRWLASHLDDAAGQRRFGGAHGDPTLACAWLWATRDKADAAWKQAFTHVWRRADSLPEVCDRVIAHADAQGWLDADLRWARILIAAEHGRSGLMRHLGDGLPEPMRAQVAQYAAFVDRPNAKATQWPPDARSRAIVLAGLARLARRDPDQAEALRALLVPTLHLDAASDARLRHAIALWAAADYLPSAPALLAAVPASAFDERLRQWQVRVALARGDDAAATDAIAALPAAAAADSRWAYLRGRLQERNGDAQGARMAYAAAAMASDFHGFLAADRIDAPYVLCPRSTPADPTTQAELAAAPGLQRALELYAIGREDWARREWRALMPRLSAAARIEAVRRAGALGWHDRILFDLPQGAEGRRLYRLRFPLAHRRQIEAAGERFALDPAWIAAHIRAESVWMREARSHANALGLMQVLPSTGRSLARRLNIAWHGEASLFDTGRNILLGSAHLREMLDAWDDKPYRAIAAYNAGPSAVREWIEARGKLPADLWIETIPYAETRDYVARVLAFSVIYDWRLKRPARPITARMLGRADSGPDSPRTFVCAANPHPDGS